MVRMNEKDTGFVHRASSELKIGQNGTPATSETNAKRA
jgi:hypothetical protein